MLEGFEMKKNILLSIVIVLYLFCQPLLAIRIQFTNNPLKASDAPGNMQINISNNAVVMRRVEIKIFDLNRRLVILHTLVPNSPTASWIWDGKNKSGRYVNSGIYILHIKVETANGFEEEKYRIGFIKDI